MDPCHSGIECDSRMPFHSNVLRWSNIYAHMHFNTDATVGHQFKVLQLTELIKFDGIIIRNGVLGGHVSFHLRWDLTDSCYDAIIAKALPYHRFLQIKAAYKLCINEAKLPKTHPSYDPAYKFEYIYRTMCNNCNWVSKKACDDLCGDETTWAFNGYGEADSGLCGLILGKPGVTKGGQLNLLSDTDRLRPRAVMSRHNCHGFNFDWNENCMGPNEVRTLMGMIRPHIGPGKLWATEPHSVWDNFFASNKILDWMGEEGFGMTATNRRDRLLQGVPSKYMQKMKTTTDGRSKVARFNKPITAVKVVPAQNGKKKYERVHVTMQSTSSCNFATVNSLCEVKLMVAPRERGKGENKRHWGIEMNEARATYLPLYGVIDTIDYFAKEARVRYITNKYWHSPVNHAKGIITAVAYDMYKEIAEGKLDPRLKVEGIVSYHKFRDLLSLQMINYDPKNHLYPGDNKARECTQMNVARRAKFKRVTPGDDCASAKKVTLESTKRLKFGDNTTPIRLCGDLDEFTSHCKSLITSGGNTGKSKSGWKCAFCGEQTWTKCGKCVDAEGKHPPLHFFPKKGDSNGKTCFIDYHNDMCFGLGKKDGTRYGITAEKDWLPSTEQGKAHQRIYMRKAIDLVSPKRLDTQFQQPNSN